MKLTLISLLIAIPIDILFVYLFEPKPNIAGIFGFIIVVVIRIILEIRAIN
jgi:hypothetical protein